MRKKLFAILMSAMMMVTFMPAMAFAGTAVGPETVTFKEFTADYEYAVCKYSDGTTVNVPATRTFNDDSGVITADASGNAGFTISGDAAPEYYYNLNDITPVIANVSHGVITAANYANLSGKKAQEVTRFVVKTPAFVEKGDAKGQYGKSWIVSGLNAYKVTVDFPEYDKYSYADQTITVTPEITFVGTTKTVKKSYKNRWGHTHYRSVTVPDKEKVNPKDADTPNTIGTLAPITFTVKAATPSVKTAEFFFDTVSAKNVINTAATVNTVAYDGAEHVVVMRDIPEARVSYKVLNRTTGKFEAVEKVVVKDVTKNVEVEALVETGTYGKAGYDYAKYTFYVNAKAAKGFTYKLDKDLKLTAANADFNAADFATVVYDTNATAADKAAVAANAEQFKAYFNDFYEFTKTADKADENKITVAIKKKDLSNLTTAESNALAKKYEQLDANFGDITVDTTTTIVVEVTGGEIEWVKAPLTKKYYNKKGTLKKTYTFAVEAKADTKVTYKLQNGGSMIKIDKNTGKVTVKKGLKVGTYKVKVTASAGKNAVDSYELTIQMAKKK